MLRLSTVCSSRKPLQLWETAHEARNLFWHSPFQRDIPLGHDHVLALQISCFLICRAKKVNEEFTLVWPMLEFSWDNASGFGSVLLPFRSKQHESNWQLKSFRWAIIKRMYAFFSCSWHVCPEKRILLVCALSDLHPPKKCVWTAV